MVTGGSCGARPPSCSVVRVAPARRCGFAEAGPAAVALIATPFLLRGGAPPVLGGRRAAPVAPLLRWVRGGGGVGGPPPRLPSGLCGGGWVGGGPLAPWRCLSSAGGEGRGRHGGPGPGGQPSARGSRPSPAPPIKSRMLAQALAGAPHHPAVVARRWPAGGGREG